MAAAIISSLRRKSFPSFPQLLHLRRLFSDSPSSSCSASAGLAASPAPHFMVEYLTNPCGLSAAEAAKVSKYYAHLQSTEKPDAVLGYLRSQGFGAAHLRKLISRVPKCLCFDVKRTLAPKLESLRGIGFSEADIVDVIVGQPYLVSHNFSRCLLSKLETWESLIGSRELLLKNLKMKRWFLSFSLEKKVIPNTKFLTEECRIPKEWISVVVKKNPTLMARRPDILRAVAARIDEIGVPRGTKMFMWMIHVLCMISKAKFEGVLKTMRKFGLSDDEFYAAIKRQPSVLYISSEVLQKKMDFFIKEVGCTPSYIARRPNIVTFSMEKRVLPRLRVMEMLKSKGLWNGQLHLQICSVLQLTDANFHRRFVDPYQVEHSNSTNQKSAEDDLLSFVRSTG